MRFHKLRFDHSLPATRRDVIGLGRLKELDCWSIRILYSISINILRVASVVVTCMSIGTVASLPLVISSSQCTVLHLLNITISSTAAQNNSPTGIKALLYVQGSLQLFSCCFGHQLNFSYRDIPCDLSLLRGR
jgi:hypothetical protein